MTTTTYSIAMHDFSGRAPSWMRGPSALVTERDGRQSSRTVEGDRGPEVVDLYIVTVTTEQPEALEAALDEDESVIEYEAVEPAIVIDSIDRADTDEYGNVNYDVTMTVDGAEVTGQITLCADEINGGMTPSGDSLDCWISHEIQMVLVSLPGGISGRTGRALIGALECRSVGEVR